MIALEGAVMLGWCVKLGIGLCYLRRWTDKEPRPRSSQFFEWVKDFGDK